MSAEHIKRTAKFLFELSPNMHLIYLLMYLVKIYFWMVNRIAFADKSSQALGFIN